MRWSKLNTNYTSFVDYFYDQREALVDSTYFQKLSQLVADVQQVYRDLGDANVTSKMGQHLRDAANFLRMKYSQLQELAQIIDDVRRQMADVYLVGSLAPTFSQDPFRILMGLFRDWNWLVSWIQFQAFLEQNPELQKGADAGRRSLEFLRWSYNYIDVNRRLSDVVNYLRRRGSELTQQSATDAYMRHRDAKTYFRFQPEAGSILFEQKLPFSWLSFNEAPRFEELQEIQMLHSFTQLFQSSNQSLSDTIASYVPSTDVADWLPPFKGQFKN